MATDKILIVDDEETLCEVLKLNLENEGFDVDIALSAEQALDYNLKGYSLILLDIMMPILAFLTCIVIGYIVKTSYVESEVTYGGKQFRSKLLYRVMIKYVCPVCMILILITPFVFKDL